MTDLIPIRYIRRADLDIIKWDHCIESSSNGLLYAQSNFLDHVSKRWDALVAGDYDTVMPLTWTRKFGISYLYQPPFLAQGGIFGDGHASAATATSFLDKVKKHFSFAEVFLNYDNPTITGAASPNFILPMTSSYEQIQSGYTQDLKKSLKVAGKKNFQYLPTNDFSTTIGAYKNEYRRRLPHVKQKDYNRFEQLCHELSTKGQLIAREVRSQTTLASVIMFKDHRRLYNMMSVVSPDGRSLRANHFLFDAIIREFSGQGLILDFEGSSIAGVAAFFKSFAAMDQPRYYLRYNNLPWPLRLIKG